MEPTRGGPQLQSIRLRKPSPTITTTAEADRVAAAEEQEEEEEEPLSPAARLFHAPKFNCHIIAVMGSKTRINPEVVKAGLAETMLKHPRFTSKMVVDDKGGQKKWVRTEVNLEDHVVIPDIDTNMEEPDQFLEDYISNITATAMDLSKPLWELHLLNLKTSDAEAVSIFRIHHSIGDGVSLVSLLLASTRKASDPTALPTIPVQKRAGSRRITGLRSFLVAVWMLLQLIWNTVTDILILIATITFLKDTDTPVKGAPGVGLRPKRFVHRTVSFDDVRLVKVATNATINDVVLGVTQAGLARYLNRRYGEMEKEKGAVANKDNLLKKIRLRSAILVNIRKSAGIEALSDMMKKSKFTWGNCIGYVLLPFKITLQDDPLDYIREAKSTVDRKKLSLESVLSYAAAKLVLKLFGEEAAAAVIRKILTNTTMSYSNVVGPLEEISFHGHPMAYLAASVYGHPHALTVHFQSYIDKMTIALAVDPDVIPDPHQLCEDLEDSLNLIKNAVLESKHIHKQQNGVSNGCH